MKTIEIARRLAELGDTKKAGEAYQLALQQGCGPEERMEAALYLLQSGGDYKVAYTCFLELYNQGCFQEDCLSVMTEAFYAPNVKLLKSAYEKNRKALSKYPYLFRKDFPPFEELPIRFYPYDGRGYLPFHVEERRFGDYVDFKKTVVSRNFFRDLENPILAADVFSQYELEYLNDNVRKSEWVARENHIYLHYSDWGVFCAHLQCLNLKRILEDKKVVFLIGEEIGQYPIDFKARFGIDYSAFPVKPLGIREINRLIWHTQLASHNGGDFFNEIFDDHPNLICFPSIIFDQIEDVLKKYRTILETSGNAREAVQNFQNWKASTVENLYYLKDRTDKDLLLAMFMDDSAVMEHLDPAERIAPALFFQPHFAHLRYELHINSSGDTVLSSEDYDKIRSSPIFQGFPYIKAFTPMRRPTTSYGATVKFMHMKVQEQESENKKEESDEDKPLVVIDAVSQRVLNRSFMIDPYDRLYADSVLVRFEDGKLNPRATFTALAAFLDLPYTESLTYCSMFGQRDPESLKGNDLGFSTAAIYRTYDEYANDTERYFIEYFMRDAYEYYGFDFHYYDGKPVDEERAKELIAGFTTIDHYIRMTFWDNVYSRGELRKNGQRMESEEEQNVLQKMLEHKMTMFAANRLRNAKFLLRGLRFVNKNGQPLRMMPKLELDPALLEQPLYH